MSTSRLRVIPLPFGAGFAIKCACLVLGFALLAFLSTGNPAMAQLGIGTGTTGSGSADSSPADSAGNEPSAERERLQSLLETLQDQGARDELVEQIRTLLEVTEPEEPAALPFLPQAESLGTQGLTYLSDQLGQVGNYAAAVGEAIADLAQIYEWATTQIADQRTVDRWIDVAISLAIVLGAAVAVRLIATRLIRPARRVADDGLQRTLTAKLGLVAVAGMLDLIPLIAFVVTAYLALSLIDPAAQIRLVALAAINASAITGLVAVVTRMFLTPRRPHLRPIPLADDSAIYLFGWIRRIVFTAVYGYFVAEAGRALGMPLAVRDGLLVAVGAVIAIMLIILVLQNRATVARSIRGPAPVRQIRRGRERQSTMVVLQRRLADIWHMVAILYIIVNFSIFALDVDGGFVFMLRGTLLTAVTIALARLAFWGLDLALRQLLRKKIDLATSFPALEKRLSFYVTLVNRAGKGLILLVTAMALLEIWLLGGFSWMSTDFGQGALSSILSIVVILLLAAIAWEVVSNGVERRLAEKDAEGNTIEPTGRTRTLLPLLRNAFMITLLTVVVLIVLSEIGVNIAPLLAGAGVIGLAIGFGAQALVRDVITGLFILFEDWFNVGDVVDIGGKSGVVEGLTIRTVRLRDLSGNVHMIQFGDVTTATNMTKEFSFAVIDIGVAYRENTDEVVGYLSEIAAALQEDETYGPFILEPLEVLGVENFADSAVTIRVRFKTAPIKQWWIAREFRRRVKLRFDELGIEIPYPHTTLYFGEGKDGKAPPGRLTLERAGRQSTPQSSGGATAADTTPADLPAPHVSGPNAPDRGAATADTAKPQTAATQDFEPMLDEIEKEQEQEKADQDKGRGSGSARS